jgi:hypothetical protein
MIFDLSTSKNIKVIHEGIRPLDRPYFYTAEWYYYFPDDVHIWFVENKIKYKLEWKRKNNNTKEYYNWHLKLSSKNDFMLFKLTWM